jgi:hypothetical protein
VTKSKPMPLRTRLAAVYGDADQAAQQLDTMARSFHLDIARLLADKNPAPTRRRLRWGLGRPGLRPAPAVVGAPAATV